MQDIAKVMALLVCIFGGLLALLAWADLYGSEWTTVAQGIAPFIIMIMVVGFIAAGLVGYVRR